MKSYDELVYALIFSEGTKFKIDVGDYIIDIYQYSEFVDRIKEILKKSKVQIIDSNIHRDSKSVIWELKIKK